MEEKLGTRFGNYDLIRRIDVGGMGEVYLAHQLTAFSRSVAIKIIRSDLVHDVTARARFLREAEVSARLKHEHILPLFDFGEVDGRLFLVTPYIEGGTLAARFQASGALSLDEARTLFVPLVQAVAYVHRRGVVHRDLKPTNIMLDTEDGQVYVRLIDFGIASLQGQSASPPLTTAGHEMGTVAYMAPERLSGIAAPSNDIFSLGVILHQMLTARMPSAAPLPPDSNVPRLPAPLEQVVRRAIVANPAERYATCEDLLRAFEHAYQEVLSPVLPEASASVPLTTGWIPQNQRTPSSQPELVTLAHSGELPALVPQASGHLPVQAIFAPEDYNAPTTSFDPYQTYTAPPPKRPPLIKPPQPKPPRATRRTSLFFLLPAAIIVLGVIIASMLGYGYQVVNAASVSVSFTPQVQVISQVFTLSADLAPQAAASTGAVRAYPLTTAKTQQQSSSTTGQVNCFLFNCQQGVSFQDVSNLSDQMLPGLKQSISQDLQSKISAAHGVEIGQISFSSPAISSNPLVGFAGKQVTVTVSLEGSAAYYLTADETSAVNTLLSAAAAHLGPGYQLVPSTITLAPPQAQAFDPTTGVSTLEVSAGAVARYGFSQAQLQSIRNGLVGKTLAQAQALLRSQTGIDPSSIRIHFTTGGGSTMPGDSGHITLTPQAQGSLPSVSLTPVPSPTSDTNNGGN